MRVGLNATCFNERPSGARQRFVGIYGALIRRRPDLEFLIYEPEDCRVARWFDGCPNVVARPTPLPSASRYRRTFGALTYWPRALATDRLDLFETFILPLSQSPRCPTVLTIHDTRKLRDDAAPIARAAYRRILRHALLHADRLVTVSQTMKADLLAFEPRARVESVYNGIDPSAFRDIPLARQLATRRRHRLPPDFLLAVGHLEARKNYPVLLDAIALLRRRGREVPLAIVGNEGGEAGALISRRDALGIADLVRIIQGATDEEVADLYAASALVVFPSRYEGFGIPVLEAMAAERPLLVSDIPVFRELTCQRGAYFPPDDSAALADAIATLLDDPARRAELIDAGRVRVRDFGFDALAAQVARIYDSLAAGG